MVSKRYPNNTNLNITNITATTKREKNSVVAVNFKKLKEKEEEKMQTIRERMVKLDFKEEFIEKMLKEYSVKEIEEKLDLLMERKNIKSPAGWLRSALKNDYRGKEQGSQLIPHPHLNPPPPQGGENLEREGLPCVVEEITAHGKGEGDKILSTEEVRERFHSLREKLMVMKSP